MKIVVIGGAHAGLSAVNAFRQVNETDEVVILEKNLRERPFISAGIKLALNGRVTSAEQVNFEHFRVNPIQRIAQAFWLNELMLQPRRFMPVPLITDRLSRNHMIS